MELLSKTATNSIQHSPQNNQNNSEKNVEHILLSGIFDSLPAWERSNAIPVPNTSMSRIVSTTAADFLISPSSVMETSSSSSSSIPRNHACTPIMTPITTTLATNLVAVANAVGAQMTTVPIPSSSIINRNNLKSSPESNSSASINCGWCEINTSATIRCLDCNEFMCNDCSQEHRRSPFSFSHSIVNLPPPIGASPTSGQTIPLTSNHIIYQCDMHNEILRYVCEHCNKLVCQCCTLREHKDHKYTDIQIFVDSATEKIDSAIHSSTLGTKCIKGSIDKALTFIRQVERNCTEISENIRKVFRQFIMALEDRECYLLEYVDKLRNKKLTVLNDQMAGLKSALSGLAETSEMLHKIADNTSQMDKFEIALKITNGQRQLEQFAAIYKDLQPKFETLAFISPDFAILNDLRSLGRIAPQPDDKTSLAYANDISGNVGGIVGSNCNIINFPVGALPVTARGRQLLHEGNNLQMPATSTIRPYNALDWELGIIKTSPTTSFNFGVTRPTQSIPGCLEHVKVTKSNTLSLSFGLEGHEDGQVSRPWGVCVDCNGNILVSDRRNNRVQVFHPDGTLKFKFGRKGVGNGEFDLPAGICVDIDNRIIVVDKDNHRVQVFTSTGIFLLKFGSYGKEHGQFQYPWDVAVNSRRQIVVSDSRNHRIQQFDSEGRFIRQIIFDNHGQSKGVASPRGVCYTPQGNIIVSDFDNHCLYLIDPDVNEILSAKGHEGPGFQEFNRPSGLCCDDDGKIIVADSKNQRIIVFTPNLEYLWDIEVRPSQNPLMPPTLDEKDRTCDVALMPDGRIVFLIELSPDAKEGSNPNKRFIHVF